MFDDVNSETLLYIANDLNTNALYFYENYIS